MKRVINILHGDPAYWCPVCDHPHALNGRWKWNGDFDKPTFSSVNGNPHSFLSFHPPVDHDYYLLKRNGWFYTGGSQPAVQDQSKAVQFVDREYAEQRAIFLQGENGGTGWGVVTRHRKEGRRTICHVYVTDGRIQVLRDTPGPLAGKTVPLEPWELHEDGITYTGPGR